MMALGSIVCGYAASVVWKQEPQIMTCNVLLETWDDSQAY